MKSNWKGPTSVGSYNFIEVIGRGGSGIVWKAFDRKNGTMVAIKRIEIKKQVQEENLLSIQNQVNLLKGLRHPNIVKYIDLIKEENYVNIVLEYVESGSIDSLVKKMGGWPQTLAALFIEQVLKGLQYLHKQATIHRDIKGANILVTKDGVVKLADFGVAKILSSSLEPDDNSSEYSDQDSYGSQNQKALKKRIKKNSRTSSIKGTPHFIAPQVLQQDANATFASDIWSLGITTIQILQAKPPHSEKMPMQIMYDKYVNRCQVPLPKNISSELEDFLIQCLQENSYKRPTAQQLLNHPWIQKVNKGALDLILKTSELPQIVQNTIRLKNADKAQQ